MLAAVALAVSGEVAATKTGRKRAISRAVKEVAHYLGNTPAVCRASYIDPRVFDAYQGGLIIRPALEAAAEADDGRPAIQQPGLEKAVLDLIDERSSAPGDRAGRGLTTRDAENPSRSEEPSSGGRSLRSQGGGPFTSMASLSASHALRVWVNPLAPRPAAQEGRARRSRILRLAPVSAG